MIASLKSSNTLIPLHYLLSLPPHKKSVNVEMPSADLSTYITLISSDGFEFIIRRETANVAKVLKKMLDPQSES